MRRDRSIIRSFIACRTCLQATLLVAGVCLATPVSAIDDVTFKHDRKITHVSGKALVTAQDGGLMLLEPDGKLWTITPEQIVEHRTDERTFAPLAAGDLRRQVLSELPAGFDAVSTAHYLIVYNTSRGYAQWCAA